MLATILPSRPITNVPGRADPNPKRSISAAVEPSQTGKFTFASLMNGRTLATAVRSSAAAPIT